jgi:hypothetical protein
MRLQRFTLAGADAKAPAPGIDDILLATCDFQSENWNIRALLVRRPTGSLKLRFPEKVEPTGGLYKAMLEAAEQFYKLATGEGVAALRQEDVA